MESSPFIGLLLHREAGHGHNVKYFAQDSKYVYSASAPYGPNAAIIVDDMPEETIRRLLENQQLKVDLGKNPEFFALVE